MSLFPHQLTPRGTGGGGGGGGVIAEFEFWDLSGIQHPSHSSWFHHSSIHGAGTTPAVLPYRLPILLECSLDYPDLVVYSQEVSRSEMLLGILRPSCQSVHLYS